jgi:transcriptional regulator with XRE-family HTH domain
MPYDPERIRRAARRIMREKGLKMSTWSANARKGERTFAEFMKGATASPRVETIYRYAEAAGVEPAELLGLEPTAQQATISTSAFRAMMALLERVEREQAVSGEALQNIRELAAAIAAELRPS